MGTIDRKHPPTVR